MPLACIAGCRTTSPFYVLDDAKRIETNDIAVQRQRFGLLVDYVGRPMASQGYLFVYTKWLVPGAAMVHMTNACCEERIVYDPEQNILKSYHENFPETVSKYGRVAANGNISWSDADGAYSYRVIRTAEGYQEFDHEFKENKRQFDEALARSRGNWEETRARQVAEEAEEERENAKIRAQAVGELIQSTVTELSKSNSSPQRPYSPPDQASARVAQHASQLSSSRQSAGVQPVRAEPRQVAVARVQKQESSRQTSSTHDARLDQRHTTEDGRAEADERLRMEKKRQNYLLGLTRSIRMSAKSCGHGDVRVGGMMPPGERVVENIRVNFTVHCPGRAGVKGTNSYFLGDGYSCVGSDMVNVTIPCEAEKSRVTVDSVVPSS